MYIRRSQFSIFYCINSISVSLLQKKYLSIVVCYLFSLSLDPSLSLPRIFHHCHLYVYELFSSFRFSPFFGINPLFKDFFIDVFFFTFSISYYHFQINVSKTVEMNGTVYPRYNRSTVPRYVISSK